MEIVAQIPKGNSSTAGQFCPMNSLSIIPVTKPGPGLQVTLNFSRFIGTSAFVRTFSEGDKPFFTRLTQSQPTGKM